ncbi:MAG: hypothetical protein KAI66_12030 [Lentisphaeria bacterium]|nr:hypothetical protein [Lentisphaeria bacterium]
MRTTVILVLLALLLAACPEDNDKLTCGPNSCQPGGTCIDDDNGAYCICDYMQGSGLTCIPYSCCCADTGEACIDDSCCHSGRCLKHPGDVEGYCTDTDCINDSECVNHALDETNEMCCVEFDDNYSICLKITEGFSCGDQTGTCGTSCTGTIESACDVGTACLRSSDTDPKAICSTPCATDADCAICEWSEDPEANISCITIFGGDKYCLINEAEDPPDNTPCTTSRDCHESQTCSLSGTRTVCMDLGALPPGAACNDEVDPNELSYEERCRGFFCFYDMCSEACVEDTDCPEGMICKLFRFSSDVNDEFYLCMGDKTCGGPDDCIEGESCGPTLSGGELTGWCRADEGTDPVGTECTEEHDTCEVFCMEPLCSEWCTIERDCPKGMTCEIIHFCLAEPCDDPENMAPATVCIGVE